MFGLYRTILAALVVLQHFAGLSNVGNLAVVAFFCLSGFLMTMLIDGPYKGNVRGFAINRFLRLYPAYWTILALTLILHAIGFQFVRSAMGVPFGVRQWIAEIVYFHLQGQKHDLLPIAWSVTNELGLYALVALGVAATRVRAVICLLIAGAYMATALRLGLGYEYTRFSIMSAATPFFLGAVVYQFRGLVTKPWACVSIGGALSVVCMVLGANHRVSYWTLQFSFLAVTAILILGLYRLAPIVKSALRSWDDAIGRLSYPMYLGHYAAAMITTAFLPNGQYAQFGAATLCIALVIAATVAFFIDRPIETLRRAVRERKFSSSPAQAQGSAGVQ